MYRLVLYYLTGLVAAAVLLSFAHVLAYDPLALLVSTSFLLAACSVANWVFARTFAVPTNVESTYITALILVLIITPIQSFDDLWFLGWAAVISIASKYILAIRGKHLFNPAAFAVALTYFTINQSASWWVGDAALLPFVLVGGVLVVQRIRRFEMLWSFLSSVLLTILLSSAFRGEALFPSLQRLLLSSPLLFFGFVMLTEPLTTPPTRRLRIIYSGIIGFLFSPAFHVGSFYTTPELALLVGNIFSYLVSPKVKLVMTLKGKEQIAPDTYEFIFSPSRKLNFVPGQYMEWTLAHTDPDGRGNRRYFTLASSPTETDLRLGVKFSPHTSSYKNALLTMQGEQEIVAAQLAGDFVLPDDPHKRCVFIAGGIGITPFRSMVKFLLDTHQRRSIFLFYANKTPDEIVYRDIFARAERELGIKAVYTLTDKDSVPANWTGKVGRVNPQWIKKLVPGYRLAYYYISGPPGMVGATQDMLHQLGIKDTQIRVDYFAGLT
jgi:ferredoxin-NADP reductase/Na+-translocating ferredoxin:NAD+ oxidoreductase RnfD subunit